MNVETGERVECERFPVVSGYGYGDFITDVTGWTPAHFQTEVSWEELERLSRKL